MAQSLLLEIRQQRTSYGGAPLDACSPHTPEQEPVMLPSYSEGKQTQDLKKADFRAMLEV